MSVEIRCPKCGGRVNHMLLLSYPPIDHYECEECDYRKDIQQKIETITAPE